MLSRRRCVLELRCRVNFAELESEPHDERILAAIEAQSAGFLRGYGNSTTIDPLFKAWIQAFEKTAFKAELAAHAKAAGQAKAKPKNTSTKGKGTFKKNTP